MKKLLSHALTVTGSLLVACALMSTVPNPVTTAIAKAETDTQASASWSPAYTVGSDTDSEALQSAVDTGALVRIGDLDYYAAHSWTAYGCVIKSRPETVCVDGSTYRYVGEEHFAHGSSLGDALTWLDGDLGLQTCDGDSYLVTRYALCA